MKWSKFSKGRNETGKEYRPGEWLVIDDMTGFRHWASELRERWDNVKMRADLWEPRHPQDFLRANKESNIPWGRPETTDRFVND